MPNATQVLVVCTALLGGTESLWIVYVECFACLGVHLCNIAVGMCVRSCNGVFAITCLPTFVECDVLGFQVAGVVICHLGWEGDSQSLSCTDASL